MPPPPPPKPAFKSVPLLSHPNDPLRVSPSGFFTALLGQPFEWITRPDLCLELKPEGVLGAPLMLD